MGAATGHPEGTLLTIPDRAGTRRRDKPVYREAAAALVPPYDYRVLDALLVGLRCFP